MPHFHWSVGPACRAGPAFAQVRLGKPDLQIAANQIISGTCRFGSQALPAGPV